MSSESFYIKRVRTGEKLGWMEEHTSAVNGVSSEGFMTMVQPTANAGATFHALRDVFQQGRDHERPYKLTTC